MVDPTGILAIRVSGIANLETGEPVTLDHWWDLASLTKILVTLPEVLRLVDSGRTSLSDRLVDWWPEAASSPYAKASIAQLFSYDAGAPATCTLYAEGPAPRSDLIRAALHTPQQRPIGSGGLYSDVGILLVGEAIAAVGKPRGLSTLAEQRGWCRYGRPPGPAVATERCAWRGRLIVGEVHDENAAALGGVAGHAGAFGRLDTVARAATAWLSGDVASPGLTADVTRCWATGVTGERYGLGFRLAGPGSLGGPLAGPGSYGISGFVGNRLWVEPNRNYAVVILSNRIHPHRTPRESFDAWCDQVLSDLATLRH